MTEKKTGAAGKVTLGMLKGKSITTSVPSFAIRFHTEDEELEEIYPTAAQDTDEEPDKPATGASFDEDESLSSSTPQKTPSISASATTSTIHSRDPSPMKEYLKGFGKRSTSVDAGMIKAGATGSSSDTWRIFHELKGKFTKTVEEKFSEIKSDRKSGSSVLRKGRLVAGGGSSSKDDSSMNSDSEDVSESSKKNDDDDISESKSQEPAKSTQESPSKPKNSPGKKVTISPSTPDVDVEDVGKAGVRKRKLESGALQGIVEYEVESGVEAKEDVLYDAIEDNIEEWQKDVPTTDYRSGTPVLVSPIRRRRRRKSFLRKLWQKRNTLFVACLLLLYILVPLPRYVLGFTNGIIFSIVVHSIYMKITSVFSRLYAEENKTSSPVASTTASVITSDEPVIKVHVAREYHQIQKYEGWLNEYPAVYNPETYKVNQTQSVFVRLEGTVLRIYHTKQRIPKRAMWNEREHKKKFYHQRIYNISYCQLKLLPEGLARSKLWSKKYPICITFKKHDDAQNPHLVSSAAMDADDDDEYLSTAENLDRSFSTSDISSIGKQPSTEDPEFAETLESEEESFCHVDSRDLETNHLYLFSRTDREKEIWYRKFAAAMREAHNNEDLVVRKSQFHNVLDTNVKLSSLDSEGTSTDATDVSLDPQDLVQQDILSLPMNDFMTLSHFEHDDYEYLRFMNKTQQVPHYRHDKVQEKEMCRVFHHQHVRAPARPANQAKKQEKLDAEIEKELQRPISDSVMWINALLGRIIFDIMKNPTWHDKIKERAQRKLSSIKLPYFIEGLTLTEMDLGHSMPIFHEASHPVLDGRGVWVDFHITYDGSICCTLETKVNLMKIKTAGQEAHTAATRHDHHGHHGHHEHTVIRKPHIYDSELDDSAESSDEDDDDERSSSADEHSSSGGSSMPRHSTGTKVIRLVNKIAASRYFQQATEYKYIKNVMEQVSNTKLMLSVTVNGLVGTLVVNIPPPPSDRIWYGFRTNPQIWLQTRPKFGERQVSVSHVTTLIEKKLLQEFQKKFVLPNMDDLVISPMSATLPE